MLIAIANKFSLFNSCHLKLLWFSMFIYNLIKFLETKIYIMVDTLLCRRILTSITSLALWSMNWSLLKRFHTKLQSWLSLTLLSLVILILVKDARFEMRWLVSIWSIGAFTFFFKCSSCLKCKVSEIHFPYFVPFTVVPFRYQQN